MGPNWNRYAFGIKLWASFFCALVNCGNSFFWHLKTLYLQASFSKQNTNTLRMEENNVTLDMNNDRIEQERCVEKRSNNSLYQHLLYCCGTEGRTLKSAVRICVVENAVHFLLLWLVLFVVLLALIGSSTISLLTQNRHFQVIPYDGYNDTTPYHFDNEELVYFLQISDLHLSRNIPHVYDRFNQFLTVDLKSIDPHFVFVTGDITDQMLQTGYFNPITPSNNEPVCLW